MLTPIELREWDEVTVEEYGPPGAEDQALKSSLGERGEARVDIEWLHGGRLRVRSRSWVGVIRLERVEIRIRPKHAGGDVGLLRMLDYASGLDALRPVSGLRELSTGRGNLVDLIALLLVGEAEDIIRGGVLSDYVTREETLSGLRGRLLLERQFAIHYGQVTQLECRHDEWEADVIENRIVAAGLRRAQRLCGDPVVRSRVARTGAAFLEICKPIAGEDLIAESRGVVYHRRNMHYRAAHQWAAVMLGNRAVDDLYAPALRTCFAFLLDMNLLFEKFVAQLLVAGCRGNQFRVRAQARERSIIVDAESRQPYTSVRPDLLIEDHSVEAPLVRVLDTKYKLYDVRRLDISDLYQSFLYAYAFHDATSASPRMATLVFPSFASTERYRLLVQSREGVEGALVRAVGIDLEGAVGRIEQGLGPDPAMIDLLLGRPSYLVQKKAKTAGQEGAHSAFAVDPPT